MSNKNDHDIYIIPPNFIESGTIMGGTLKLRNAVEALCISLLVGIPEFYLPFSVVAQRDVIVFVEGLFLLLLLRAFGGPSVRLDLTAR